VLGKNVFFFDGVTMQNHTKLYPSMSALRKAVGKYMTLPRETTGTMTRHDMQAFIFRQFKNLKPLPQRHS